MIHILLFSFVSSYLILGRPSRLVSMSAGFYAGWLVAAYACDGRELYLIEGLGLLSVGLVIWALGLGEASTPAGLRK